MRDLTGEKIGPFRIESRLGSGAMGMVYRARHEGTGKYVALKTMFSKTGQLKDNQAARFEREIELMQRFRHPNIVRFLGASEENGIRYYAMELVEGKPLDQLLRAKRTLSLARAAGYVIQICEALQEIHSVGVLHRDLKPANILISTDHKVKLTDLGIAKDTSAVYGHQLTQADHTVGTVAYMSPEQLQGKELNRRSDLYSLGIVLYELVIGKLPFEGETVIDYLQSRLAGDYPVPSSLRGELPASFDRLIAELLQTEPDRRPRDAYVVMQRLLEIQEEGKHQTHAPTRIAVTAAPTAADAAAAGRAMPPAHTRSQAGQASVLGTLFKRISMPIIGGGKRRRRHSGPIWESTPFLLGCLLLGGAIIVYSFWPLGQEELYRRGSVLIASADPLDWQRGIAEYFDPLDKRFPNHPYRKEVQAARDQWNVRQADRQAETAIRIARLPADASEAFRKIYDAMILEKVLQDPITAAERYRAIVDVFESVPEERPWVLLAQQRVADQVQFERDEDRLVAKRKAVASALERGDAFASEGKPARAIGLWSSVVELYGPDPEVADLVEAARERITQK